MHRHTSAPATNHPSRARALQAPASAPTFVPAFATVFVFALATAPGRAGAAIVTNSQSHLLTANVTVGDVTDSDTASGSTVGPVDARAEASVPFSTAVTTLNLSFDGTGITGRLRGTADASPAPNPSAAISVDANGEFSLAFQVTEPTPFVLGGTVSWTTRHIGGAGRASVRLTEDGTQIGAGLIDSRIGGTGTGGGSVIAGSGTLQPSRAYALTGSVEAGWDSTNQTLIEFFYTDATFTLTVSEPAAAGLALPAAALLLSRRRRGSAERHGSEW